MTRENFIAPILPVIINWAPYGAGHFCPLVYIFLLPVMWINLQVLADRWDNFVLVHTVSIWRHGNWTRGARFMTSSSSDCSHLPSLGVRCQDMIATWSYRNGWGPHGVGACCVDILQARRYTDIGIGSRPKSKYCCNWWVQGGYLDFWRLWVIPELSFSGVRDTGLHFPPPWRRIIITGNKMK